MTETVRDCVCQVPVLVVQRPRSVGKSTVLNEIARHAGQPVINLELPDVRPPS
jgi:hypothetical protein